MSDIDFDVLIVYYFDGPAPLADVTIDLRRSSRITNRLIEMLGEVIDTMIFLRKNNTEAVIVAIGGVLDEDVSWISNYLANTGACVGTKVLLGEENESLRPS